MKTNTEISESEIAGKIDHTLLRPDAVKEEIVQLCEEAKAYGFAAVCVPPCYVKIVNNLLQGTRVRVATVVGFPLGYQISKVKFFEAHQAITEGADEIDYVMNISAFKSGSFDEVENELGEISTLCQFKNASLKVIIETALLTEEEIIKACKICAAADVNYVKTSTGFASRGASVEDVRLMRANLPSKIKIKAAGGIKTYASAKALIEAGADRLGCSASIQIVEDAKNE
ncbi:MAG: deoxyribose-phosphate aldolase [Hymenobacteraceae bacterium]|nr:deoxyribose-phosphate aldolase [Hymenobacteraceae bacterium]MDX5394671.1 deoxyribose-phosphate aldolase [Hymenobacteraceae bacterium]MDX5442728.1 deoxyribose-phosphate aldolase [Hymenobacteraceae bacterium]MDX5510700.1 deoxyribose-phosphate aldolase [Hymenobacteraceae bacterium]